MLIFSHNYKETKFYDHDFFLFYFVFIITCIISDSKLWDKIRIHGASIWGQPGVQHVEHGHPADQVWGGQGKDLVPLLDQGLSQL